MHHHQSSSSKHHFDTMFVVLCVIATVSSHTISDTSKKPINRTSEYYKKSFIEFLLDPSLTDTLQSLKTIDKNLITTRSSNSKLTEVPVTKRSATVCALLTNFLSGDQVRFCQRHHDVLESILPQAIQTTENECKRITKDLKWNCPSLDTLFEKSSSLAYTREAALVRSILNASMMYLVAKICSENSHVSCGCLFGNIQSQFKELRSKPLRTTEIFLDDQAVTRGEIQSNRPSRSSPGLSISDLTKLNSGSPIRLTKSVDQHLGCIINSAFASVLTKVLIDSEDIKNLNKAHKILNENSKGSPSSSHSKTRRVVDIDDKDLAQIKWTKSAINLHNNQIGRKIVREATQKRCRCHGLSGSCQFQTCWEQLSNLSLIMFRLRSIYLYQSVKTSSKNLGTPERPDLYLTKVLQDEDKISLPKPFPNRDGDEIPRVGSEELLYIYNSPEYCEPQPNLGHYGTKGRACTPSSNITLSYPKNLGRAEPIDELDQSEANGEGIGPGICERLCCDRGYQRELILDVVPCSCRFKFCCRVECDNCLRQIDQHHCL